MHTTATLHAHPACNPTRIFEVRSLAREHGCTFIVSKPKHKSRPFPNPFGPNGGGHAA